MARQLGQLLGLPVIHLDQEFWQPGWVETEHDAWQARMHELVAGDRWIIDGNYSRTMAIRLQAAQTVIYLDLPRWLCMARVLKRVLTYSGRTRPDMPEGCEERLDLEFLKWVWNYPGRSRPGTVSRLQALPPDKELIWLRSSRAVRRLLQQVQKEER